MGPSDSGASEEMTPPELSKFVALLNMDVDEAIAYGLNIAAG
jgi:hypothetical protein